MSKPTPVLVDCDGGIDCLFGLSVVAARPELDLRAVTVCAGKYDAEQSFANAAGYAAMLSLTCRLAKGSARNVLLTGQPLWDKNGPDGKLGASLSAPKAYEKACAWDVIYEEAVKAQGELVVLCFGPLTNLALALFKHEDLAPLIKKVVFVGGSYDYGNYTSVVEINMATDPEAGRALFRSGIDMSMIGWNAQLESALSGEQTRSISADSPLGRLFALYGACSGGICGPALAAASLAEGGSVGFHRYHVTMENKSSLCRGRTTPLNMYSPRGFVENTDVAMTVDIPVYADILARAVSAF